MSEMELSLINNAIEKEDLKFLTKITGIGKKTASRLILELKGKLVTKTEKIASKESIKINNIQVALENLGFLKSNIENLLKNIPKEDLNKSDEDLIKWALSEL
jgi:Holliday junction DNA helicase RuvA